MWSLTKTEHLKSKHTIGSKLPVVTPAITLLLVLSLTGGIENALPAGAWNWWYTMLLPGMMAILCYLCIQKDKELNFSTMLSLGIPAEAGWMGKIIYCSVCLLLSNILIFGGTLVGGMVFGTTISPEEGIFGALLLSISYLWAIPLYLFLSARFGLFACVFSGMALSAGGVAALADTKIWWICPSAIPVRLMCPVLGIQPNGLPVPKGSPLSGMGVIVPGVLLSLLWLVVLTFFTVRWFAGREGEA